ncbi:MAG: hypothetical protein HQ580_17290 [Planctomycetes bacterium]|nr:hypothetical protein [Planctomycetota bacterium]
MNKIREQIEKRITDAVPGYVFARKDFQDIASSGSKGSRSKHSHVELTQKRPIPHFSISC